MYYEDLLYEQDDYAITGFINSSGDLEHNIYKQVDGGCIDLKDRVYSKDELLELLEVELGDFVNRNVVSAVILGHEIHISAKDGKLIKGESLDNEVYEISQSILEGLDCGEIYIESLNVKASWSIAI